MRRRYRIDTLTMLVGLVLTGLVLTTLAQAAEYGRLPYERQAAIRLPTDLGGAVAGFRSEAYGRLDRATAEEAGAGLVRRDGDNAMALTLDRPGLELVHERAGYRTGLRFDAGAPAGAPRRRGPALMFVIGHSW